MLSQHKDRVERIKKSEFFKNVTILVTGTSISQIIPLLISPIVARLYVPSDYAVLATYTSVTILLTIIATGMYDAALMLDEKDEDAINTGSAAVLITIIITILSALTMFLFRDSIARWAGNENVRFWLYLVPITVFCSGFYSTLNVWNNRKKRYKRLASNRIIMTTITSSLTLGLGFLHFNEKGLLISLIVGQTLAFALLLWQTVKNDRLLLVHISKSEIKGAFLRHKDFPKYNMPQGFLDGIRESSTVWILSNFFGSHVLGSFSFAKSILMRPLQIIGNAISQVFYQKASSVYNQTGNIYRISRNTFLILFALGLPLTLIIFFFGDTIFIFAFGLKWKDAGVYSQILIIWLFLGFIASSLGNIPLILNKQRQYLLFSIIGNLLPIIVFFIVSKNCVDIFWALTVFAFSYVLIFVIMFVWLRNIVNAKTIK